jgi:ABC-type dipeptide/oligopeptide/nickel transport system ATPase component
MISMALACEPDLIIADEPTTALDVTVQAEILALFRELQQELGVSVLFVSHDLAVVGEIADRVAVMHRGRIVETGRTADVLTHPNHPYSRALLSCAPRLGAGRGMLSVIDPAMLVDGYEDPAEPGAGESPPTGPLLIGAVLEPSEREDPR